MPYPLECFCCCCCLLVFPFFFWIMSSLSVWYYESLTREALCPDPGSGCRKWDSIVLMGCHFIADRPSKPLLVATPVWNCGLTSPRKSCWQWEHQDGPGGKAIPNPNCPKLVSVERPPCPVFYVSTLFSKMCPYFDNFSPKRCSYFWQVFILLPIWYSH